MTIGIVKDVTTPDYVKIQAKDPLPLGKYVSINREDDKCLGLVETSVASSSIIKDISNFDEAKESVEVSQDNSRDKGYETLIRVMGTIESLKSNKPKFPFTPTLPGTTVSSVDNSVLELIFSPDDSRFSSIGNLLRENDINVKINLDEIFSRHLAILAMTGMGKSNFVAVLAREIGRIEGACVIFDYHNDYGGLRLKDNNGKKIPINHIDAKIAPRVLTGEQFIQIIDLPKSAVHQADILIEVFEHVKTKEDFWGELIKAMEEIKNEPVDIVIAEPKGGMDVGDIKDRKKKAARLLTRIKRAKNLYANVIDPRIEDPKSSLKQYAINVLNATSFTEKQADIGLSYYLDTIFSDRKKAALGEKDVIFDNPLFFIIEEAHTFIKKEVESETKFITAKIAKEARKYALGLGIVSQRPSKVDEDILSQMGSFAVLKMIQKRDQDSIFTTSEDITEEMTSQLSSLNVGEAFLSGRFVKVPTLVKIDEISEEEKKFGKDISATKSFARAKKMRTENSSQELIDKEDL